MKPAVRLNGVAKNPYHEDDKLRMKPIVRIDQPKILFMQKLNQKVYTKNFPH